MKEQELRVKSLACRIRPAISHILADQDSRDSLMALSQVIASRIADDKDLTSKECWAVGQKLFQVIEVESKPKKRK